MSRASLNKDTKNIEITDSRKIDLSKIELFMVTIQYPMKHPE